MLGFTMMTVARTSSDIIADRALKHMAQAERTANVCIDPGEEEDHLEEAALDVCTFLYLWCCISSMHVQFVPAVASISIEPVTEKTDA